MDEKYVVKVQNFNYSTGKEGKVVEVAVGRIARALTLEQLFRIVDDWLNYHGGGGMRYGEAFGEYALQTHPTLQGQLVNFILGVIKKMATESYTDARNQRAIATCRKIAGTLSDEDVQQYI